MKQIDVFSEFDNEMTGDLTIIEALDRVQEEASESKLSPEFWQECSAEVSFLCEQLELTPVQVVLVAILCEKGVSMSWRQLGQFLGMSRLKTMSLTPDLNGLLEKRWVFLCASYEMGSRYKGFMIARGVIKALRHNRKFIPEKIDGLTTQAFVDRLARYFACEGDDRDIPVEENVRWMLQLVDQNAELPICRSITELNDQDARIILMALIVDYSKSADTEFEGLSLMDLNEWVDNEITDIEFLDDELRSGHHELFRYGWIEHCCDEGMIDTEKYKLTAKARNELLAEYKPHKHCLPSFNFDRNLLKVNEIQPRKMFYNAEESKQIDRLKSVVSNEGLSAIQDRLAESGMRRGITCLFYGSPGTGKTESVLQLARESGRDIMQIDIAGLRDKYVGESEKNIKSVFARYRSLCEGNKRIPILFFNEADAIINSRFERTNSSVEKMDNAMQNIILQELENLDGILIATTNLTGNLDKAFDRRFLFKVEFTRPDIEAKKNIWHSMIPGLNEQDCQLLAGEFDFSGGQIENIARKCKIDNAISGNHATLDQIRGYCNEEYLNRNSRSRIGF